MGWLSESITKIVTPVEMDNPSVESAPPFSVWPVVHLEPVC